MTLSSPSLVWTREYTCLEHTLIMWRVATWQPPPQTLRGRREADITIYGSGVFCGSGSKKLQILDHREKEHSISSFQHDYELYQSLETGDSNKQRNCLHFSVCIYSLGQTRNKCSNSIKQSRKCTSSPSLQSPQLKIDCLH